MGGVRPPDGGGVWETLVDRVVGGGRNPIRIESRVPSKELRFAGHNNNKILRSENFCFVS